jgi:hypothetical protein
MPFNRTESEPKSRVSQKNYMQHEPALPVVERVAELARNAIVLYPDIPSAHFPPLIVELAEPEIIAAYDELVRNQRLIALVRSLRRAENTEPAQEWLFPEIQEHAANLRKRFSIGSKTVERSKACRKDLERRLKLLNKKHRGNTEVIALTALIEMWPPLTPHTQGLTLAEVDAMKARAAGLV